MGFFGNSFSKPGKGVSKEEAARRNYFDMVGRHFFDFVKINLLFFACTLIFFAAAFLFAFPYFYNMEETLTVLRSEPNVLLPPLPFVPFMFIGPFIAGLTFVLRNWARQEHAFWVSDFFEHTKKNLLQGLLMSVINTVFVYTLLTAALFYAKSGVPGIVVLVVFCIVSVLWFIINFYTYTIMVTFKMSLANIIRNAIFLALGKLPQNLFFCVIIVAIHFVLLYYLPIIWILLMAVVLIALTGFTMNYYGWHIIAKYMIPKVETEQEEAVFEDVK